MQVTSTVWALPSAIRTLIWREYRVTNALRELNIM